MRAEGFRVTLLISELSLFGQLAFFVSIWIRIAFERIAQHNDYSLIVAWNHHAAVVPPAAVVSDSLVTTPAALLSVTAPATAVPVLLPTRRASWCR